MKKIILLIFIFFISVYSYSQKHIVTQKNVYATNMNIFLEKIPIIYKESTVKILTKMIPSELNKIICFKSLCGGLSKSKLFLFEIGEKKYVLRLLGIDKNIKRRKCELIAHQLAASIGIAPKIFYVNSSTDPLVIVMEYIDGRKFLTEDLADKKLMKKIMITLKKFHKSKMQNSLEKANFKEIDNIYNKMIEKGAVYPSCFNAIRENIREAFKNINRPFLPTHGDLNPNNILITKDRSIYFIDWCESRMNNPFYDIGWLASFSGATTLQIKYMLDAYFDRSTTKLEFIEAMLFYNISNLIIATILIGKQNEKNQKKLDDLLQTPIPANTVYFKQDLKIHSMNSSDLTKYALSWVQSLQKNQHFYQNLIH